MWLQFWKTQLKKCTPTASCSLSKYGFVSTLHLGWLGMALMALQHGHSSVSSCWFYVWLLASTPIIYKLCWFWECHLSSMPLFCTLFWYDFDWIGLPSIPTYFHTRSINKIELLTVVLPLWENNCSNLRVKSCDISSFLSSDWHRSWLYDYDIPYHHINCAWWKTISQQCFCKMCAKSCSSWQMVYPTIWGRFNLFQSSFVVNFAPHRTSTEVPHGVLGLRKFGPSSGGGAALVQRHAAAQYFVLYK